MAKALSTEDINKQLREGIDDVLSSDRYRELLSFMSRFHNYSLKNKMLIWGQNPEATMVKGYKSWQEVGRNVNKGEKSIKILVPTFKKEEVHKKDPNSGELQYNNKGEVITEKKDIMKGYITGSVFDVSQTNGKEIPSVRDFINSTLEDDKEIGNLYEAFKDHITAHYGNEVLEVPTDPGVGGYYHRGNENIAISSSEGHNNSDKFRVLVHEFAHSQLHNYESGSADLERGHKEAQAESVAYIVSQYYGLDTGDKSFGYIGTWARDTALAIEAIEEVQEVTNTVIHTLDELQQHKVEEFYKQNDQDYHKAVEQLKDQFHIDVDDLSKKYQKSPEVQFELLNKNYATVVSASLAYSESTDKFHLVTDRNRRIPLNEINPEGEYVMMNKEIENHKRIPTSEKSTVDELMDVRKAENNHVIHLKENSAVTIQDHHETREDAEKAMSLMNLSQTLHDKSFMKSYYTEHALQTEVQEEYNVLTERVEFNVSEYLKEDTKSIETSGKHAEAIAWGVMKNKDAIKNVSQLEQFALHETKHMPSYKKLREGIEASTIKTGEPEKQSEAKERSSDKSEVSLER